MLGDHCSWWVREVPGRATLMFPMALPLICLFALQSEIESKGEKEIFCGDS